MKKSFAKGTIVTPTELLVAGGNTFPAGWHFRVTGTIHSKDRGLEYLCEAAGFGGTLAIAAEKLELVARPPKPAAPKNRKTLKQLVKSGAVTRGSTLEAGHGRR